MNKKMLQKGRKIELLLERRNEDPGKRPAQKTKNELKSKHRGKMVGTCSHK
jgi:hypothetical protein